MSRDLSEPAFGPLARRASVGVRVGRGSGAVTVGGGAPIAVQSMTNTDTADIEATTRQVAALARAGSEFVRITVDRDEAAAAVPHIRDRLAARPSAFGSAKGARRSWSAGARRSSCSR